jgi:AGCS family alanine or glycine:cation symporter
VAVFYGATYSNGLAWTFASIGNGLMAAPNLIALLALSGVVFSLTRQAQREGEERRQTSDAPAE